MAAACTVWVDGRRVVDTYRSTLIDEERLYRRSRRRARPSSPVPEWRFPAHGRSCDSACRFPREGFRQGRAVRLHAGQCGQRDTGCPCCVRTFSDSVVEEFGWSRASISGVLGILALVGAIAYPVIGRHVDRQVPGTCC
ncbi:MAG: hypothetical protein QM744_02515 [Mesorhizobium sp.]